MSLKPEVSQTDHLQGNMQAPLELVEYGDYQCPYCGQAHALIKTIQKKLGNKLRFVFRHFPLASIHPEAPMAALAAEAADQQGRFWEMHDTLFENQNDLHLSSLMAYARQMGLDIERFERDLENKDLAEKVVAHFESGVRSGVNGTPGIFINGELYSGSLDEASLSAYLQHRLHRGVMDKGGP